MHILIINPNTTTAMTGKIEAIAKDIAHSDTKITAQNPAIGPASIQGPEDGAAALPGLFSLVDQALAGNNEYDAIIIACFDDTGLEELKGRSNIPVIGIGEAAYHAAALLGGAYSVVTTMEISIPILEANIQAYGFSHQCAGVRASGVPVLALEDDPAQVHGLIEAEARSALQEDGASTIVLGCAGMADLAIDMTYRLGVPVVDGVAAAVGLCEMLYRLRRAA